MSHKQVKYLVIAYFSTCFQQKDLIANVFVAISFIIDSKGGPKFKHGK